MLVSESNWVGDCTVVYVHVVAVYHASLRSRLAFVKPSKQSRVPELPYFVQSESFETLCEQATVKADSYPWLPLTSRSGISTLILLRPVFRRENCILIISGVGEEDGWVGVIIKCGLGGIGWSKKIR